MAAAYRDGQVSPVHLAGSVLAPAVTRVNGPEHSDWVSGPDAVEGDPLRLFRQAKRYLGQPSRNFGGVPVDAKDVISHQLRWVLTQCVEYLGEQPDHITFTHPANWTVAQLADFRDVIGQAASAEKGTLPEPHAAANYFAAHHQMPADKWLAVFDLGGGTTDVALLHKQADRFELAPQAIGNPTFGGRDLTEALVSYLRSTHPELDYIEDSSDEGRVDLIRLAQAVRAAKEQLSTSQVASVAVPRAFRGQEVALKRTELNEVLQPMIDAAIDLVVEALDTVGVRERDVHGVLLAGGGSRMPLVSERVKSELGFASVSVGDPKHTVGMGAAIVSGAVAERSKLPTNQRPKRKQPAKPTPVAAQTLRVDLKARALTGASDSSLPVTSESTFKPRPKQFVQPPKVEVPKPPGNGSLSEPTLDHRVAVLAGVVLITLVLGVGLLRLFS